MNNLIIIPARYASSRFPGKPLVDIMGKSMLQRVWEICAKVVSQQNVIVATDDDKIYAHCAHNDMRVAMTSSDCLTGTDRCSEIAKKFEADYYINVQGDEPLLDPNDIKNVIDGINRYPDTILNAMCDIETSEDYLSKSIPKVVASTSGKLLYMSRSPIPGNKEGVFRSAKKQVCIYAFPRAALLDYGKHEIKTPLEEQEDIEILRFLELGYSIQMISVSSSSIAVDHPEDLEKVKVRLRAIN